MIVRSGIPNNLGVRELVNLAVVASVTVTTKPEYSAAKRFEGDYAVTYYMPNMEDYDHLYYGSLDDSIEQMERLRASWADGATYFDMKESVSVSTTLPKPEGSPTRDG